MIRIGTIIFFCVLLAFLGFCAGMLVGSIVLPAGGGLSAPAIALGYGLTGLVTGLITAIVMARYMPYHLFRKTLIIVGVLSLITFGLIVYRINVG